MNTKQQQAAMNTLVAAVIRQAIKDMGDTRLPACERGEASELVEAVLTGLGANLAMCNKKRGRGYRPASKRNAA